MDNDIRVRQGAQLNLRVTQGDPTSSSATVILRHQDTQDLITQTAAFVGGVAEVSFGAVHTAVVGVYDYQVNENFGSSDPLKYPDPNDCDGECEFPTVTICESLDGAA